MRKHYRIDQQRWIDSLQTIVHLSSTASHAIRANIIHSMQAHLLLADRGNSIRSLHFTNSIWAHCLLFAILTHSVARHIGWTMRGMNLCDRMHYLSEISSGKPELMPNSALDKNETVSSHWLSCFIQISGRLSYDSCACFLIQLPFANQAVLLRHRDGLRIILHRNLTNITIGTDKWVIKVYVIINCHSQSWLQNNLISVCQKESNAFPISDRRPGVVQQSEQIPVRPIPHQFLIFAGASLTRHR